MNDIVELLQRCSVLIKERADRLSETGEGYNLLSIFMHGDEELLHSKMIASLLDPGGSHHQGPAFLKSFLSTVGMNGFDADTASVICEKHIGFQDGNNPYGRIDIFLRDAKGHRIIIENKWNAGDQPMQLVRYHEYAPDAHLLYLTRFGKEPSSSSRGHLTDEDFKCISYSNDILSWLGDCLAYCKDKPALAVAIDSYISLLTKLNMPDNNSHILNEITKSAESIEAAFLISDELNNVKINAQRFLWKQLFSRLESGGLDAKYCSRTEGREIGKDFSWLDKNIKTYVESKIMKEEYYRYGIRVKLGSVDGHDVYGAVLLRRNLYYAFYTDSKELNQQLSGRFNKADGWEDLNSNYLNFAWKFPYSCMYNFVNFKHKDVRALAAKDASLVNLIYEGFIASMNEVKDKIEKLK